MQREAKREVTAVEGIYIAAKEVTRNKRRGEKKRGGEKKRKCRIGKREREKGERVDTSVQDRRRGYGRFN